MKKFLALIFVLVLVSGFVACTSSNTNQSEKTSIPTSDPDLEQGEPDTKPEETMPPVDSLGAVKIELNETTISAGKGVTVNGNVATITASGTYEVSGELKEGQLRVEADNCEIYLIFNNASIHCSNTSPLFVKKADHIYLTLAAGTTNT